MRLYTRSPLVAAVLSLAAILFLTACTGQTQPAAAVPALETDVAREAAVAEQMPSPTAEMVPTETSRIPVEALRNATYTGIFDETVTLIDGKFENSFAEQPFTVEYIDGTELFADLDGDGLEDAIVFLIERGGGTAAFTYVAAQLNRSSQPVDAGAAMVEDRTQIRLAAIQNGQVVLDLTTRGPGDGDCCPTHKIRKIYALQADRLVEVPVEDQQLVKVSADDLNGTTWKLLELDANLPVLADSEVSISFQENQISGSGGCNNYTSRFSLGGANPFIITISPIAATQQACPDPLLAQENAYFSALENAGLWGYNYGKLVLAYPDGQEGGFKLLLFAPQNTPTTD